MPHTDLSAPLLSALGPTPPTADEVSVRASDSLHALMAALSSRNIERLALANDAGQLVGAVSVLDVLKFFAVEQ
jgi:CBS domain-containing protein